MTRRSKGSGSSLIVRWGTTVLAVGLIAAACSSTQPDAATTTSAQSDMAAAPATTLPETSSSPTTAATTTTTAGESSASTTTTATISTTVPAATTTSTTTSTTVPAPTSTTLAPPSDNRPPEVAITAPGNLSSHLAAYDTDSLAFLAVVSMSASAVDPDGDPVTIDWFSSVSGYLGTGESITASLITIYDSSQPFITARATDPYGATSEATIQIIVWVPSDT